MSISINELREQINILTKIVDERQDKYYAWTRNIIVMATGMVSVLVALKSDKSQSIYEHYLFSSTIGLLSLGILFGVIILYAEVQILNQAKTHQEKHISKLLNSEDVPEIGMKYLDPPKYFSFVQIVFSLSLVLALICLVLYSVFIDSHY